MSTKPGTMFGLLFTLAIATCRLPGGEGYGSGAPTGACTSQRPGHVGTEEQSSASPYSLTVSSSQYTPGQTLTVQITGGDFQGFLIQARKNGTTTAVGFFSSLPSGTKTNDCSNAVGRGANTATHSSTATKRDLTLTWSAPQDQAGQGAVEFVATVAQVKATYWMGIKSALLTEGSGATTTHGQETTGSQTDQTTTAITTHAQETTGSQTDETTTAGNVTDAPTTTPKKTTPKSGATMATTFNLLLLAIPAFLAKLLM